MIGILACGALFLTFIFGGIPIDKERERAAREEEEKPTSPLTSKDSE